MHQLRLPKQQTLTRRDRLAERIVASESMIPSEWRLLIILNACFAPTHLKAYISLLALFSTSTLYATEPEMTCTARLGGISNHLDLTIADDDVVRFSYTAVTRINAGGLNPSSCSIDASKLENKRGEKDSIWNKTSSGYIVKLINSAMENDQVVIKRKKAGFILDFKDVNLMNCGHSSVIAERISIARDRKKCIVHKLRN
jgi:hypothetical protein